MGAEGAWRIALFQPGLLPGQPLHVILSFQGRNSMIPFLGSLETTCSSSLMQRACELSPFWHLVMWGSGRAFSMEDGRKSCNGRQGLLKESHEYLVSLDCSRFSADRSCWFLRMAAIMSWVWNPDVQQLSSLADRKCPQSTSD